MTRRTATGAGKAGATRDARVAICAIAKNEGRYLEEWAIYHHLLGFDPIVVYNHESTDDSEEVLEWLEHIGVAEWKPWSSPPRQKPQWLAYEDAMNHLKGRTDWVALIDLDEFFVLPRHDSIQSFLDQYGHLEAIAVNWKLCGSAGHERRRRGLVIERFNRCSVRDFKANRQVKTLARIDAIETPRVHTCHFREGVKYQTVLEEELPPNTGSSEKVSHDLIRLNHYFTRSKEEWADKVARGKGAKRPDDPRKRRSQAEFDVYDRNEEEERDIVVYVSRIRRYQVRRAPARLIWKARRWIGRRLTRASEVGRPLGYAPTEDLREEIRRLQDSSRRVENELAELRRREPELRRALKTQVNVNRRLQREIERARSDLERVARSRSWRLGQRVGVALRMLALRPPAARQDPVQSVLQRLNAVHDASDGSKALVSRQDASDGDGVEGDTKRLQAGT